MGDRDFLIGINDNESSPLQASAAVSALRSQALEHEGHRLETVAEFLTVVALLTLRGLITGSERVEVAKAHVQFGIGMKLHRTNAAHCLPGQALLDGKVFHPRPDWAPADLHRYGLKPIPTTSILRNLSARTDIVDENVNKVDSGMERLANGRGLTSLYGDAIRQTVGEVARNRRVTLKDVSEIVRLAFDAYRNGEVEACRIKLADYQEKVAAVDGLAARELAVRRDRAYTAGLTTKGTVDRRAEDLAFRILAVKAFLAVAKNRAFMPDAMTAPGFERIVRDLLAERHSSPASNSTPLRSPGQPVGVN